MRKLLLPAVVALVLSACGGAGDQTAQSTTTLQDVAVSPDRVVTTSTPAATDSGDSESAASTASPAVAPSFDGPAAPDFDLALSDGSTFLLSDEEKPVYIVFWAEW